MSRWRRDRRARRHRDDRLPAVRRRLRARGPPAVLLDRLSPDGLAPAALCTGPARRGPNRHRLRVPELRCPLPRRATMRPVQHLVSSPRSRWALSVLRRTGCDQRPLRRRPARQCHSPRTAQEEVINRPLLSGRTLRPKTSSTSLDYFSRAGRSATRRESCSLVTTTTGEPSRSCHGEGPRPTARRSGDAAVSGPSGVRGAARTHGLVRNRRDPSAQPRQQRPLV